MTNKNYPPLPLSGLDDIGGAIVRRSFTLGGERLTNSTILSEAQVKAMPRSNFRALRDNGYLQVFPKPRSAEPARAPTPRAEFTNSAKPLPPRVIV
jgi:hypothetical protein